MYQRDLRDTPVCSRRAMLASALCLPALLETMSRSGAATRSGDDIAGWGRDQLDRIRTRFYIAPRGLFADAIPPMGPTPDKPAFMWGCGVLCSAFAAFARLDAAGSEPLRAFVNSLDVYRTDYHGIRGYDVLPAPKPPDRYYDDNAWMVLALLDAHEATHNADYLRRARETFAFVMSGQDDVLGGGIYWRERDRASKNTCSNAPTAAAAVRLYGATHESAYLDTGKRLVAWTTAHLQDSDGLFFDAVNQDGSIGRAKWSYNSGLMIRAYTLLHSTAGQQGALDQAQRIARAAVAHWVRPETGAVADDGAFAHLLSDALLSLYEADGDEHWLSIVRRALSCIHDERDAQGWYPDKWGHKAPDDRPSIGLLGQASAARGLLSAARFKS